MNSAPRTECGRIPGFLVLGIEYFEGETYAVHKGKENFDFNGWINGKRERAAVLVRQWVEVVRKEFGGYL